ncbi:CapA family protein [Mesorhizobium sp. M0130]|uniref:CapA family protein n=1 Tax=Mesorhizobium sp. M0130 TaxID=2956887 RepID=UPI0033387ACB
MIKINVLGDLVLTDPINELAKQPGSPAIFSCSTRRFLSAADLNIFNLESPITSKKTSEKKVGPALRGNKDLLPSIAQSGLAVATLANNHMMDFGTSGLEDTLNALDENNIEHLGAGMKGAEAPHRLRYIAQGTSASFINVAEQEFGVVEAGRVGVIKEDIASMYYWIIEEKTVSDFVIVIIHGGAEYFPLPSPERIQRARLYADFGADAVIYHHTHVISAYESYKSKPIFYGLGNFLFYWPNKGADWNTGMAASLVLDVEHKRISGEPLVHRYSPDDGVRILSKQEAQREFSCLDNLNVALADSSHLGRLWEEFCLQQRHRYLRLNNLISEFQEGMAQRGVWPIPMFPSKSLLGGLNALRCVSHREASVTVLEAEAKRRFDTFIT